MEKEKEICKSNKAASLKITVSETRHISVTGFTNLPAVVLTLTVKKTPCYSFPSFKCPFFPFATSPTPFMLPHRVLFPVIFKEVNTCNPATITGTLSRISLDDEDDPKLPSHQEGGVNFTSLPGNIPPPNLIVQVDR